MADTWDVLVGYINRMTDNLIHDAHRMTQRRATVSWDAMREEADALADFNTDVAAEALERLSNDSVHVQRAVQEAMKQLSDKQRLIIGWTFLNPQPLKPHRIAKLLNVSSVRVRVEGFRARQRLKKILEKTLKNLTEERGVRMTPMAHGETHDR